MRFSEFKRLLSPRRNDRHYEVIVTALDDDDVRHEVQRELPRVLVDAATGRDAKYLQGRARAARRVGMPGVHAAPGTSTGDGGGRAERGVRELPR